jgi:uncharacterized membrane protein (DUF485 family)
MLTALIMSWAERIHANNTYLQLAEGRRSSFAAIAAACSVARGIVLLIPYLARVVVSAVGREEAESEKTRAGENHSHPDEQQCPCAQPRALQWPAQNTPQFWELLRQSAVSWLLLVLFLGLHLILLSELGYGPELYARVVPLESNAQVITRLIQCCLYSTESFHRPS